MTDTATKPDEATETPAAPEPQQPESDTAPDAVPGSGKSSRRRRAPKPKPSSSSSSKPSSSSASRSRGRRKPKTDIAAGMAGLYTSAGMAFSIVPGKPSPAFGGMPAPQAVGLNLASNAQACGEAWAKLADENDAVRDTLERILAVSAVGSLITAHLPIMAAAAIAYGVVPPELAAAFGGSGPKPAPQPEEAPKDAGEPEAPAYQPPAGV